MEMKRLILIVDDEPYILRILEYKLQREGFATCVARSAEDAEQLLSDHEVDLAVLDVSLATPTNGFDLAAKLPRGLPQVVVHEGPSLGNHVEDVVHDLRLCKSIGLQNPFGGVDPLAGMALEDDLVLLVLAGHDVAQGQPEERGPQRTKTGRFGWRRNAAKDRTKHQEDQEHRRHDGFEYFFDYCPANFIGFFRRWHRGRADQPEDKTAGGRKGVQK